MKEGNIDEIISGNGVSAMRKKMTRRRNMK